MWLPEWEVEIPKDQISKVALVKVQLIHKQACNSFPLLFYPAYKGDKWPRLTTTIHPKEKTSVRWQIKV